MKKLLVFILSLSMMFVAGTFTAIYADDGGMGSVTSGVPGSKITIGGDARVRGIWENNWDMSDDADDADNRYWDQRVRLKVTAKVGEGVEVRTRLNIAKGEWNNDGTSTDSVTVDYAYLHIPVAGLNIDVGRQKANWGNKFQMWDVLRERLKITKKINNTMVGGFIEKRSDSFGTVTGGDNLGDDDGYGLIGIHKFGDIKAGAKLLFVEDGYADGDMMNNDEDGHIFGGFLTAKIAGFDVAGEFATKGGDRFETDGDAQWGCFVSASKGLNDITVSGLLAYTQDGYVADSHFTPTAMVGTDNPTGMADFGRNPENAAEAVDSFLGVVSAEYKAAPDLTVVGRLAYGSYDKEGAFSGGGDDASMFEADAGLSYKLAKNTTYSVDLGYLSPNDITASDDAAMSLIQKVQIGF